ncbi:hypothetical protein THMIRHAM_10530 [Thiomicrorhabdus immobilis]|uniref:FAD assembly factor SdhE n=1 Tax=Thiomicrorhabdus immobilis TaxID=2791037 RepID=A0ABM7MCY8_9GAMM|nr:succinate dehydrogenase assembly factor 2 [Thiomicrorhabdus immobilis]BCN93268.1 hypothetical protein THMIRHAM_10530 [Thiomicrorhabdus immobilis]
MTMHKTDDSHRNPPEQINQAWLNSAGHTIETPESPSEFIIWQKQSLFLCKRGNLETELLLQSYIHSLKPPLAIEKVELINQLLQESEQNLFHWLLLVEASNLQSVRPLPKVYLQLIDEIRDNYLNSNK